MENLNRREDCCNQSPHHPRCPYAGESDAYCERCENEHVELYYTDKYDDRYACDLCVTVKPVQKIPVIYRR